MNQINTVKQLSRGGLPVVVPKRMRGSARSDREPEFETVSKFVNELRPSAKIQEIFPLLRGDQFLQLKENIRQRGIQNPLEITKDGQVICGHNRLQAAKELGMRTVPCRVRDDLDPADIMARSISDNALRTQMTRQNKNHLIDWFLEKDEESRKLPKGSGHLTGIKGQKEIANVTGVSERTVRRRKERIEKAGRPWKPQMFKLAKKFSGGRGTFNQIKEYLSGLFKKYDIRIISINCLTTIAGKKA